ncbi:4Fe-4S ferredoxin iron-sulfur binding domain protein [Methanocaldococcus vulcanius M7]|uniref:4Fe-4S ferredoxin iron-sulfur binding domain protein n=1 Tax=Methanocaldococcus vulcanius (strain ATCC 700851 / DSM 12094 / M7) TaxID=579137 RepID=C9RFF5_METVM|nr:4Fe-4S binding protein [Methanocaldococcus vulcanius]ACX72307.1 4Fe-4S ferredoxin iron-sulfur binding domain protein [Methanocaldococcus vulcanius M7]
MDKLQTFRKISQTIFFIRALILGNLNILAFVLNFVVGKGAYYMLRYIGVILAILFGRVFCGWICPFGYLFELSYRLRVRYSKLKKLPTLDEKIHSKLIYLKYISLLVVILIFSLGIKVNHTLTIAVIVLTIFIILSFIYPRFFCRYFCPVGALLSIFSYFSIFRLKLDEEKCVKCRLCEFKCPMQIKITEKIDQKECIRCFECKSACRKNAITYTPIFKK